MKKRYTPGQKWHVTTSGPKPCSATTGRCPYATSSHYDTYEEAENPQPTVSTLASKDDILFFETNISAEDQEKSDEYYYQNRSLRDAANIAQDVLARTGKRPLSPLGEIRADLPGNQKIVLKRETYDHLGKIGVKYRMRLFQGHELDETTVALNTKIDYELFVKNLNNMYTSAAKYAGPQYSGQEFVDKFNKSVKMVTEVESMSRGAGKTYRTLGLDIFSHDNPGELKLELDYDNSTLQPSDIKNSLGVHAGADEQIYDISASVSGKIKGFDNARWNMERMPNGDWYIGCDSPKLVAVQKMPNQEEVTATLQAILVKGHKVPQEEADKIIGFCHNIMQTTDTAVDSYKKTVGDNVHERNARMRRIHAEQSEIRHLKATGQYNPNPPQQNNNQKLTKKISRLFG